MEDFRFKGLGVALPTPFNDEGTIDYQSLEKIVDYTIEGGVDFLVVMGTTGESPTVNHEEKKEVSRVISSVNSGRVPMVLGIGSNDTRKVIKRVQECDIESYSAILSVVPYYNKPSQEGLYLHFEAIASASPLPIILYNIPGRTGVCMSCDTTLKLSRNCKNIMATKEASGNISLIREIIEKKEGNFSVLSGDDALTFDIMEMGGDGVISVAANIIPSQMKKLVNLCHTKDFEGAKQYKDLLNEIFHLLFVNGNPSGIKAAMAIKGLLKNNLRLPLTPVKETTYKKLEEALANF